ncbi:AraC family transcriptional regulator [Clostridium sp. MB40-C1]|uniref:AraC family transcriptional regulator n=1 Tax=Clostridium sp. MB40-C1 TaxID=3070996 RepID=UPI0027E1FC7F|nr:AraC family transcriptional regulator [Clostridium sp. MB40-C1]WMJ81753.1 AraC family transcriptional regulator [Clostridium sp. MB40-C1]
MKIKKCISDTYYKYIEEELRCKISDELLGKKYVIDEQLGTGNFTRMKIEEGLEVSRLKADKTEINFDNRGFNEDTLEVGYCYSGNINILTLPDNTKFSIKAGDIFMYKVLNDVEYFKFEYNNCKTISIHMNFSIIKSVINPIWEDKIITDWQDHINTIFKENILIIEKASYKIKRIAEQIESISIDNMLDYMKLKIKTIEFLATFFQEKSHTKIPTNSKEQETEIIIRAKDIINEKFQSSLSVRELASNLNISIYKLQQIFKNNTGNTVYEYIKKVRIEKAKYLLKNTDMSILQIVNEIGYENPSKFSSLFKSYNNMTPLQYRKVNMNVYK